MVIPEENTSAPPVWDATTYFQYSFEDNESATLWNSYINITVQSTGGAADGSKYAVIPSSGYLVKHINNSAGFWVRFCVKFSDTINADRNIFTLVFGETLVAKIGYLQATDQLKCYVTNKVWSRSPTWQTIEYYIGVQEQIVYLWVDGTYAGSTTTSDISYSYLIAQWCNEVAATTVYIDAIKITGARAGLPGNIVATQNAYVREGDVEIDGVPFNILPGQYQEQDISGFAPRLGTGAPAYSDLSGFQHFLIPSLHNGIGQPEMIGAGQGDENKYLYGLGIDTTGVSVIRLANNPADTDTVASMTAYDAMPNGEIVSCDMAGKSIYGLKFGSAKASASYTCLVWRAGATLSSHAFTCTNGVQDVLYNGQYLFITLGGAGVRMQKTTDLLTFTDVGSASLPPVDMGAMAIYDEFLWVADRTTPIVYRAAQTDASDLAKETVMGLGAHRIGPGNVPINSMCAFEGKLYIGRQDGLYTLVQDADYVYVHPIETYPQNIFNCRSLVVYNGYLIWAVGQRVYRLGGTTTVGTGAKMEITPGPTSDEFPYQNIEHWDSFTIANGYLFAVGYDSSGAGYVFCYNGSGWHRLYDTDNDYINVGYPAGLNQSFASNNEPLIHWATCRNSASGGIFYESYASARMGEESPVIASEYEDLGSFATSWMSFGLPFVPKLFRLVRFDIEGATSTCPIQVTYYVQTGQEEKDGTLGILVQNDANFLMFPTGTWGNKLKLYFYFSRISGQTPIIRKIVVQYMDRPPTIWGYSMTLDLSSPPRTYSGNSNGETVESLKQYLRNCREKESYVRFVDMDGNESDVMVSSGPRFMIVNGKPVAQLTLMVVKRYINTPGLVGVTTGAA